MPIRVRCPKCNETADLPDQARGKKGLCNRCGTPVQIPAGIKKVCVFCHADVTDTTHIKDPDKNYVCETCWKGRHPEPQKLQDTVAPLAVAAAEPEAAPTSTLDPDFAAADSTHALTTAPPTPTPQQQPEAEALDHHDDDDFVHDWPYDHKPPPSRRRPRPRRASRLSTVFSLFALLISGTTAYWTWTHTQTVNPPPAAPTGEEAHRAQMLVLKGQAEILVEMGHLKEGVARYEELERLVKDKEIADPALRDELLAAWRARDAAVAKQMVVEQVATAANTTPPSTARSETTITMIDEPKTAAGSPKRPDPSGVPTTQRSTFDPN